MTREREMLQANMLKYAKNIVLLADDITPDNAFHMLSVIKNSLKRLENSLYKEKNRSYDKGDEN